MPKNQVPKAPGCKRVNNPCKICLQAVTAKTGVQCQGACEAWVHFECLNYTPGKIKDIQGGFITVTCPCPDCKTTVPKEYRTDEPFACSNVLCPANNPPACEEFECQANEMSRSMPARCPPPGTLRTCGINLCRDYSGPNAFRASNTDPCMEGHTLRTHCEEIGAPKLRIQTPDGRVLPRTDEYGRLVGGEPPTVPGPHPCKDVQAGQQTMPDYQKKPMMPTECAQPGQKNFSPEAVQQMCKTVGDLATQLNCLMDSLKGMGAVMPQPEMKACGSSGISCGGKAGCNKCGGKGQVKKQGCTGGCGQAGQSGCAQPCHCPGNPVQRHR